MFFSTRRITLKNIKSSIRVFWFKENPWNFKISENKRGIWAGTGKSGKNEEEGRRGEGDGKDRKGRS